MIYENNYGLEGKTCLFYKAETKNRINDLQENVEGFGIEYKASSATGNFKKIKLLENDSLSSVKNGCIKEENYVFKVRDTPNYPFIVMIKNLEPNTSYKIRTYFIKEGETSYFNQITLTTLVDNEDIRVTCQEYVKDDTCSQERYDSQINNLKKYMEEAVYLMNNVANNINWTFNATMIDKNNGAAADNGMNFQYSSIAGEGEDLRSVIIHEMGHNELKTTQLSTNMKFMEFATDCEKAVNKTLSSHEYPLISSNRFDYLDDALIVAAMRLGMDEFNS